HTILSGDWSSDVCSSDLHPVDRAAFNPVRTGLALLRGIVALHDRDFRWKQPPYEYESERLPIDVIAGGPWVREWAEGRRPWSERSGERRGGEEGERAVSG